MNPEANAGSFAHVLKNYRAAARLSRNEFAKKVELDGSYVHRLEMGNRRPSRKTVLAMADALDLEGETLNTWLTAAGHGPVPLVAERNLSGKKASGRSHAANSKPNAARVGTQLEKMGIEEPILARLAHAMDQARAADRSRVANIVSRTLRRAVDSLEIPVRKAVIPIAGSKHRIIQMHFMQRLLINTIHEAADCGIDEIIVVIGPEIVDSFFSPLKQMLDVSVAPFVNLQYCEQPKPLGLGDALLQTQDLIDKQPFAVLLPDDVLSAGPLHANEKRELRLMIDVLAKFPEVNLVAVTTVAKRKMLQYGIAEVAAGLKTGNTIPVKRLVEKPETNHAILSSRRAVGIVGRYVLQPAIFGVLEELKLEGQMPLEITSGLQALCSAGHKIWAFPLRSERRDLGEVLGRASDVLNSSSAQ